MKLFALVKSAVTTRQAAQFYGLEVKPNGMTRCPFHPDHHPSMKVASRYYCFGCHETGDVIDFVAKLFNLAPYEAAKKIAADFRLEPDPSKPVTLEIPALPSEGASRARSGHCAAVLMDYERVLKRWKDEYAPIHPDEEWNQRFVAACHALPRVSGLIDALYSADSAEREETARSLLDDGTIDRVEAWLKHYHTYEESEGYGDDCESVQAA